jgi:hypothetical protein
MSEMEPMLLDAGSDAPATPAKDVDGIPYCPKHHCRMEMASGGKKGSPTSYYRCKVDGCDEKAKRIKTDRPGVVPAQPQECPRCNGVICERDPASSNGAKVVLKCPCCGWKSTALAVPQLAAAMFAGRRTAAVEPMVGDR